MTMWTIMQAVLLVLNAFAILNEDRFLIPYGWGFHEMTNGRTTSIKVRIIGMLHTVQYLRVPLIVANIITIFVKVVFT